jgi:hypothetical protein
VGIEPVNARRFGHARNSRTWSSGTPPPWRTSTWKPRWGYARAVITKTYQFWESSNPDQKRRLQKLIFPQGLTFDGEALGTPITGLIFSDLGLGKAPGEGLVAPGVPSSNTTAGSGPANFARMEKFLRRLDSFRRQEVAV